MLSFVAPSHRQFDHAVRRFDKQMRATNACLSVLALADDTEDVSELIEQVSRLVASWITGRGRNVRKLTRQIERRVKALQQPLTPTSCPLDASDGDAGSTTALLDQMLARLGGRSSANIFVRLLLGDTQKHYRKIMNLLRGDDQLAHKHIVAGRIGTALNRLTDQPLPKVRDRIQQAAAMQARLLVSLTAIEKADALRLLATRPLGDTHLATAPWPVVSRVYHETFAEQARLILRYGEVATSREAKRLAGDTERSFLHLQSKQLLPNAPVARIILEIAKRVGELVPNMGYGLADTTAAALDYALREVGAFVANPASQPEDWSRMSFVEFRLGLTTNEAATLLARNMLNAFDDIDARVYGRPAPSLAKASCDPPVMRVRLLAEVLRSVARTDPLASLDPNPVNKNGEAAYETMIEKLRDPALAERAAGVLGIDINPWFAR